MFFTMECILNNFNRCNHGKVLEEQYTAKRFNRKSKTFSIVAHILPIATIYSK